MADLIGRPYLMNRVLEAQKNDEKISVIVSHIGEGKGTEFSVKEVDPCIIKIGFVYLMIVN